MSFYFMQSNLLLLKMKIILNRFLRLLIPYIGWAFIIWKINHIINIKFNKRFPDHFNDLKQQLMWGRLYLSHMWFQWNLIAITFVFIIIIFIFRRHYLFIMQIILILSYASQYSGYYLNNKLVNYKYFNKITIAVLFESTPFSIIGFSLGYYKVINHLQKFKMQTLILSIIIYNVISDYKIFINIRGINYQGLNLNIQSICIIFIFSLFPSEKIKDKYIAKFFDKITKYSAGIYYLHVPIHDYLRDYFNCIKTGTFFGNIILYLISKIICFLGILIFGKTPIKHLFC